MPYNYQTLQTQQADGVLQATLNRPDAFNTFNETMLAELFDLFRTSKNDGAVRAILLTGAGRAFCAGEDLRARADQSAQPSPGVAADRLRRMYNPLIREMLHYEKPVIAAVNGVAAGAGASLAMACDIRYVSDRARFVQVGVRVGMIADSGASFLLPRLVGMGRALEYIYTGAEIDAQTAERVGLANRVVPADKLLDTTLAFARHLASGPTRALGLAKTAVLSAGIIAPEQALELEAQLQEEAAQTADFREGISAYLQRRTPEFKGQ